MGYIKDESTGKFVWVDDVLDDSAVGEQHYGHASGVANAAGHGSPTARPWLLIGLVVALVAGVAMWGVRAAGNKSESISNIRTKPASYDGQNVVLKGRVGDVFEVGGSCAYYLHQGRDTIVVFTRGQRPRAQQTVTIHGSISMGYLDGAARPALFQSASDK